VPGAVIDKFGANKQTTKAARKLQSRSYNETINLMEGLVVVGVVVVVVVEL
jgi:hypothetical protein